MFKDSKARRHLIWMLTSLALTMLFSAGWKIVAPMIEPGITIRFHYSGFKLIQNIVNFCLYASAGWMGASFGLLLRDYQRYQKEKKANSANLEQIRKQRQDEQRKTSLATPEGIYNYILQVRNKFTTPSPKMFMFHTINAIKNQLDEMNELQEKLDKLFSANDMADLGDARNLLQDIEDAICMASTKRLINYYIIGGENALFEHVEQTISDNELLLTQARGVLTDIVEYVNGDKTIDDISNHIAIFRKTIQNFMKEENENEAQLNEDSGGITLSLDGN
ncbi:hypothetical protein IJJ39_01685 [Candidatus Saccharibacteria bacterium]|nr:hypothetical protein [Candidatus Saccharibacteria bacterium]